MESSSSSRDPSGASKGLAPDSVDSHGDNEEPAPGGETQLPASAASNQSYYPPLTTEEERAIEQLWFGLIPVVFSLAKKDIASVSKPDEIYVRLRGFMLLNDSRIITLYS
jgi:hypothetical protein